MKFGVQLYNFREALQKDFRGTLKEVAKLGFDGVEFPCMYGNIPPEELAEYLKELKLECGFVLLDGLEAFDHDQLMEFDAWLQEQDLQAICTRVGTEDCTIIIEDGYAVQEGVEAAPEVPKMNAPIPMEENKDEMEDW